MLGFIKSVVFSDDKAAASLKRAPRMLLCNMQTNIAPNVASLRNIGATQLVVSFLVSSYPNTLLRTKAKFEKHVREVLDMGIDPANSVYVHALKVFAGTTESTRESKKAVFRRVISGFKNSADS